MQKPEESLEDFRVRATEKVVPPPAVVWLRFTGDVKVLKPLAGRTATSNTYRFSWFQSALAAAGAVGMMALVLLSAVFIGINDVPQVDTAGISNELETDRPSVYGLTPSEEPHSPEIRTVETSPPADDKVRPVRSAAKPRLARRIQPIAYRPGRQGSRPHHVVTKFVPTTLVIYAENGEIKTRIEPQIAALYKNSLTNN